jgi:alanyl-tRNA synthetase
MKSAEVRTSFLKYFEERGHKIVASDSLVPSTDPTLLFTSAGMVQFKPNFQNPTASPYPRATSCQKCLRTSDIERVGTTLRHLTFFEMLGNFSFGDYFKKESIAWGWEFLTKTIGLPGDRFVVSVHKNDDEAFGLWEKLIPKNRIYRLDDDTNFWTMGPTGPCGPCSEILWDRGPEWSCGKSTCGPACDCDRYLEVWNHVFTQFDRSVDGKLTPLPRKNIDTGMGLERLALLTQGVASPFGSSEFQVLYAALGELWGFKGVPLPKETLTAQEATKFDPILTNFRKVSDHARAVTFMICDGILPSNEGRGYVLRRLLRQAVRAGEVLRIHEPFLYKLTGTVIDSNKSAYPDLLQRREMIASVVKMEEEKFLQTLDTGTELLKKMVLEAKKKKQHTLPGNELFQLYDTYGFPFELTKDMVKDAGLEVDEAGFEAARKQAVDLARQAWKGSGAQDVERYRDWKTKLTVTGSSFQGYWHLDIDAKVLGPLYRANPSGWVKELQKGEEGEVILNQTTFYPEGGGQVGDVGKIESSQASVEVLDTQTPVEGMIVHRVRVTRGTLKEGDAVTAKVDREKREATRRHHTATHMLHKALREVLGPHVTQAGSLVAPDRLRFDFNHNAPLSREERERVEDIVNRQVFNNIPIQECHMTKDEAHKIGAMMLFGEKYGENVRAIMVSKFDCKQPEQAWSLELCGGTHVDETGQIGLFKIISQTAVSAGVRRLEAVAGFSALALVRRLEHQLQSAADTLKTTPEDLTLRLEKILSQEKNLQKEVESLKSTAIRSQFDDIAKNSVSIAGAQVVSRRLDGVDDKQLSQVADRLRDGAGIGVVVLASVNEGKISFVVSVQKALADRGWNAGHVAKEIAAQIQGSGGGRPDFAQGGGKNVAALDKALAGVEDILKHLVVKSR